MRVLRTRTRIDSAFVQLLRRRPYADIRVSDITRKASVGRATFYAHYAAKDDLLRSQFERIVAPMLIACPHDPSVLDASRFFAHIRSAPQFYRALMGPNGGTAPRILRDCFEARARQTLALNYGGTNGLKLSAVPRFVGASLIAITECWFEQGGRETPQQMQAFFADLVSPGLARIRRTPGR